MPENEKTNVYTLVENANPDGTRAWENNPPQGYNYLNVAYKEDGVAGEPATQAVDNRKVQNSMAYVTATENEQEYALMIANKRGASAPGGKVENESETQKESADVLQKRGFNQQQSDAILAAVRETKEETGLDLTPFLKDAKIRVTGEEERDELGVPERNKATTTSGFVEIALGKQSISSLEAQLQVPKSEESKVFGAFFVNTSQLGITENSDGKKSPNPVKFTDEQAEKVLAVIENGVVSDKDKGKFYKAFNSEKKTLKTDFVISVVAQNAKNNPIQAKEFDRNFTTAANQDAPSLEVARAEGRSK